MPYLCIKQLPAGGQTYCPGEIIPGGVILPERARALERMGYISKVEPKTLFEGGGRTASFYTQEEIDTMVSEAVELARAEAEKEWAGRMAELQGGAARLDVTDPGAYDGMVTIPVKGASDGQYTAISASVEEIQQVFEIMQMNAEDGARAIPNVESENVLILLHAADSRKTIKDAAKRQADKLLP